MPLIKKAIEGENVQIPATFYDPALQNSGKQKTRARWLEAFAYPIKDQQQKVTKIVFIVQDVTERMEAEKLVQASKEQLRNYSHELEKRVAGRTAELEETNKQLEAFSYTISHDLRAPLRAIDGYSQFLRDLIIVNDNQEASDLLDKVQSNAQRMKQLIDDLLAFSRVSRASLEIQEVHVQALVQSVVAEIKSTGSYHETKVHFAPLLEAQGDPSLIRQIWYNLLSNAFKYSQTQPEPVIEIGSELQGEFVVYWVRDNGIGFDMQYVGKLFQVFERLHQCSQFEGTGVGLAIVKRIVERHQGQVWAEGKLAAGATFYFSLPQANTHRNA